MSGFTVKSGFSPRRTLRTWSAMIPPARACASCVEAPRWGVNTVFGAARIGLPVGGSFSNTSRAAPAIVPDVSASARAASCTISPRAVHDVRGPLHERELLRADHPLRLRGEGRVDAEIVRLHQEGGEAVDESDPPLLRRGWREIWIERDHVHPEGLRPPRDLRADP